MVVKEEFNRFCQTTSVKGIPRAAKAEHKGLRLTWIIAVVMMVTLATYQVTMLVLEYVSYPSYTITNEKVFHPHNDKPVLPTLTLCNENPFSTLKPPVSIYGLPTLDQYYSMVDTMTHCPGCNATMLHKMALMRKLMRNTNAYFQNIGENRSSLLGHDVQNFILSCKELVFLGMTFVERDCTSLVNITISPDVDFFSCYRITLPNNYEMDEHGMISGVSLVLYLDNINSDEISMNLNGSRITNPTTPITKFGAVAIATHHEGSAFPAIDGVQLPAGISAKIQLAMEKQYRLQPPYGECKPSPVEGYEGMKMCISDCYQKYIQANCSCTDARMVKHMETSKNPFCLKTGSDPSKVVSNYMCATNHLKTDTVTECLHSCPLTCREFGYTTETSFSKWPNPSSMSNFYNTYIKGKDFEPYFTIVKDIITGNCSSDLECMTKYIMAQKMIEDNFLQVKFHLSDVRYMATEEKVKIGIADFCSKLGGILNLWAGITVVLILELIELLGRIVIFHFMKKGNTTKVEAIPAKPIEKPPLPENNSNRYEDLNHDTNIIDQELERMQGGTAVLFQRVNHGMAE